MAAPVLIASKAANWEGNYPLGFSTAFDATGADMLVVVMATVGNYAWTPPACTFNGVALTPQQKTPSPGSGSLGTLWLFTLAAPAAGSHTLAVGHPTEYCDSGSCYIASVSGVASVGASTALNGTTTGTASLVSTASDSLAVGVAHAAQITSETVTGTPSPTTVVDSVGATNNFGRMTQQAVSSLGQTISLTSVVAFNFTNLALVELVGVSGGPAVAVAPLALALSLGAVVVTLPPRVQVAPLALTLTPGLLAATKTGVLVAPLPGLTLTPGATTVVVTPAPPQVAVASLALGLSLGGVVATLAGAPPAAYLAPLTLALALGALSVRAPVPISLGPLSLTLTPGTLAIGAAVAIGLSPLGLTLTLGAMTVAIPPIDLDFPLTVAPGASALIAVAFAPTVEGARTGTLAVTSNAAGSPHTRPLSGTGSAVPPPVTLKRLHTAGNQFVDSDGANIRLASANWHGGEGENYIPHGTWLRPFRDILDDIRGLGLNCIRVPFSGAWGTPGLLVPSTAFNAELNPEFVGKTVFEVMDLHFDYCSEIGLYVVLDHHRRQFGAGADGGPIGSGYTEANWLATWGTVAARWKDHPAVVGADLHNEPHDLEWDAWATLAETCGDHIHTIAPDWIAFVEGVGNIGSDFYWWGGQLAGVATRPVVLAAPNRLAYSPHEYGQSVGSQTWQARGGYTPAGWPGNQYPVWSDHWGYIFEDNLAPIWIGEMGGFFGVDGSGNLTKPYAAEETVWMQNLVAYLNGSYSLGATPALGPKQGMSFAWWSWSPLSADTGGLVQDDFITPIPAKLALIAPLLGT